MKADLHIHSHFSNDGEKTIREIVQLCLESQVELFSVTDHNCVRGNQEAAILVEKIPALRFVPGIEIDCHYQGTDLHLLGYNINWRSQDFSELDSEVEQKYLEAVPQMVANLAGEGIYIDQNELMVKSEGKAPSAELFAEILLSNPEYRNNEKLKPYMEGGQRSDMPLINFYLDYFAQGKPAYVPIDHLPFRDAITLVRDHGGIPVIAHPGLNFRGKEQLVEELLDGGAAGLEIFNNYHSQEQVYYFARLIKQHKAIMTCGSDYHGKIKPLIGMGQYLPTEAYQTELSVSLKQLL